MEIDTGATVFNETKSSVVVLTGMDETKEEYNDIWWLDKNADGVSLIDSIKSRLKIENKFN